MFLNQILEDYKESDEKQVIFTQFIDRLWKSSYSLRKYKKYHTYKVYGNLLANRKDLIDLFTKYNKIEYIVCRSYFKKRMEFIDYIRIHINNMYGYLVDKDIYYLSEYYKLLLTPKNEYFKVIDAIKSGVDVDCESVRSKIDFALKESDRVKQQSINKKHAITWYQYKILINTYLERIFDNYVPVYEYEEKHGWDMRISVDGWSEDNYVVKYFCKSITGYMRNHIRDSKPKVIKQRQCAKCYVNITPSNNRQKYCETCWKSVREKQNRKKSLKYYHKNKV